MEKKQIVNQTIAKIENLLQELKKLSIQIAQEEEDRAVMLSKIDKISSDTEEIRKGVIG